MAPYLLFRAPQALTVTSPRKWNSYDSLGMAKLWPLMARTKQRDPGMRNLMEQSESNDSLAAVFTNASDTPAPPVSPASPARSSLAPGVYPICGLAPAANGEAATAPSYVYSIGRIEPRFPRHVDGEGICPSYRKSRNGWADGPTSAAKCPLPKTESLPYSPIVLGNDN
jgi:hypothetical protein